MKLSSIIALLFLLISFNSHGQSDKMKEKREQIKSMKIEFLTTELDLSQSEADKFWPIYTAFEDKEFELKHSKSKTLNKIRRNLAFHSLEPFTIGIRLKVF